MRWLAWAAFVLLLPGCLSAPGPDPARPPAAWLEGAHWDTTGTYSRLLHPGNLTVLRGEAVTVKADDGVPLSLAVWRPDTPGKVPVILDASPYWPVDTTLIRNYFDSDYYVDRFVPHGYAYARMAVRGTGGSGGCMGFLSPREGKDLGEALDWLGTQPWSSGRVGMVGYSYDGAEAWIAAAQGNPHLVTIVPGSAIDDVRSWLLPNGTDYGFLPTAQPNYLVSWGMGVGLPPNPGRVQHASDEACQDSARGLAQTASTTATGEAGIVDRAWWDERDYRPAILRNYHGSVFLIHGLQDGGTVRPSQAFPFLDAVAAQGNQVKVLVGQWRHELPDYGREGADMRWDHAEVLLRWFEHALKGLDAPTGPAVDVQDSSHAWRTEAAWPPTDVNLTSLYYGGGVLSRDPQPAGSSLAAPEGASANNQQAVDSAWHFGLPLAAPMRFAGLPTLRATLVPSLPVTVVAARLDDVAPNGTAQALTFTAMDLRYASGGLDPVPVVPGQPLVAHLQFLPVDAIVPAGHTLRLSLIDNGDGATLGSVSGPTQLQWGGQDAVLRLPVIERAGLDGRYPGLPG
jgi:predicted acyl esterase